MAKRRDKAVGDHQLMAGRMDKLPIEYFDSEVLLQIGKTLGKPIQIDTVTELATRGRFAKICVQIDLSAPLIPWIRIGKHRFVKRFNMKEYIPYENAMGNT